MSKPEIKKKRRNIVVDATGFGTKYYRQWQSVRTKGKKKKKDFVKLHAIADDKVPVFLSAVVTKGYYGDSPQFEKLIMRIDKSIEIGDVCGDPAYLSRANVQIVYEKGGVPIIKLKSGITIKAKGFPAWHKMIELARKNPKEYEKRYHRRSVIEGYFNGLKIRLGNKIRARRRHNQNIELLSRVIVWNALVLSRYYARR